MSMSLPDILDVADTWKEFPPLFIVNKHLENLGVHFGIYEPPKEQPKHYAAEDEIRRLAALMGG